MRVISVVNQKGGCGKTTVSINLAAALKLRGNKVLLIDMDPQAHASLGLNITARDKTAYDLLAYPKVKLSDVVCEYCEDFHLVVSTPVLSALEQQLSGVDGKEFRLGSKLARHQEEYDYVIIDSPPNIGLLTFNTLIACKEVLIPVEPSYFSLNGLERLLETVDLLQNETDHVLIKHILINNLDRRTNFSRDFARELERNHNLHLMDGFVSHSVHLKSAALRGVPVFDIKRAERLHREFMEIAEEIEQRNSNLQIEDVRGWMTRLHGPKVVEEGVLFSIDAPGAENVFLTGEFVKWSPDSVEMEKDSSDVLWKTTVYLGPGEYEYRFIVDGVWIKDPRNKDTIMNEFGQENSLLIV
ncbi:MAG: AAA family ATPase [Candidatus Latescibacteria bacterium]|nr:AAA family ATPase [bacterium]MBD3423862.1 AAA family ATPase [Candidatus Latescibacterota bacterium]